MKKLYIISSLTLMEQILGISFNHISNLIISFAQAMSRKQPITNFIYIYIVLSSIFMSQNVSIRFHLSRKLCKIIKDTMCLQVITRTRNKTLLSVCNKIQLRFYGIVIIIINRISLQLRPLYGLK